MWRATLPMQCVIRGLGNFGSSDGAKMTRSATKQPTLMFSTRLMAAHYRLPDLGMVHTVAGVFIGSSSMPTRTQVKPTELPRHVP